MPAISVVMPVYNALATLGEAVASILAQTEPSFELVAIDDGSTDGSGALLDALARADARLVVLHRPHEGIVAALNAGLAVAQAPLIARMDADDLALPTRFAAQRARLDAEPGLGLVGCLVAHDRPDDPAVEGFVRHVAWLDGLVTPAAIARERFVEAPFAHPSVMFRRALVAAHGGYRDGPFPEDYDLWLRWLEAGVAMAKVPERLLVWRDRPGRLTRTDPRYATEAFYRLKAAYLFRWLAAHNPRHPDVVIWGSGKTSRQRAAFLEAEGARVVAYVDVDPARRLSRDRPIWHYRDVVDPGQGFIVPYVGKRDAHAFIRAHLVGCGFEEGRHFIFAS